MKKLICLFIAIIMLSVGCKQDPKNVDLGKKTYTQEEIAQIKQRLMVEKKVDKWPTKLDGSVGSGTVVELTASECTWLGGTVVFWGNCAGEYQKCIGSNGHEACITEKK